MSACNVGDLGLISALGRSPGEGNGNPLRYSCLENSMDKEPGGLQSKGHKALEKTLMLGKIEAGGEGGNRLTDDEIVGWHH